ncbi:MAG: CHASE3 domain-containing protein, partial [Kofleriaceae bacterium]
MPRRTRALLPTKSLLALIAGTAAVFVIALLAYRAIESRSEAAAAVSHTNEVQRHLYRFTSLLKDAESGQRGYLLTGNERYLQPYELARSALPAELATLDRLTDESDAQQQTLEALSPLVTSKLAELADTIAKRRVGDVNTAVALVQTDRGELLMERIRVLVEEMIGHEQVLLATRTLAWERTVTSSSYVMFGGLGILFLMIVLIGYFASRDFRAVEAEAFIRRMQVQLGGELQGDLRLETLGEKALRVLTANVDASVAAIYVNEPEGLRRIAGHALEPTTARIRLGDTLAGQAAKDNRIVHLKELPEDYLRIGSTAGSTRARELMIIPASVDGNVQAVTELGFLHALDAVEREALTRVAESIAIGVRSARDRGRLVELLEETQLQSEEMQTQQEELRVTNEELEQQARVLQHSQAQLENQQAELAQINTQLEEQSQSLERQRDELTRGSAALQRSNEYKSQFLANMSHELRTPLNSSLILAKLLADNRKGNLDEEQIKFATTIYSAGNDLLTLINDILDLSKIEAGMLDVRLEQVSLAKLVDQLASTFEPVATQKQLTFEVQLAEGAPATIVTDPQRFQQILRNLIANALKFTERGGVTLLISGTPNGIELAVRDTGIGIAADQHAVIFDAFRQADGASTRKFGGTGLGLSISRDLARLLGGDLRVESAPDRGSTFTLTLPLQSAGTRPAPAMGIRQATRSLAPPPRTPLSDAPFPDDRARVDRSSRSLLVIEDDVSFARVLYDLSHELEFLSLIASTAEAGLALARQYLPSAIVLDVGLPDRSGLAVLDALKRDARTRHIPVHMVSATDYMRTALEMGAVGYALKPIQRTDLVTAIQTLEAKFTQKLRRVLIVEDDETLRESTAKLLEADDVETITAGTSAEALEHLKTSTFDCMVLDLSLPDRSGLELLEEMARGEDSAFPPVIVYTGRSLSAAEVHELERFSRSIIIKGARSPERLLDEVTLFLHQVES